jgi:glycine cleavage system transcriptional repressor
VAAVTGALLELRCNLRDVATSVLSGHFALVVVCDGPAELAGGALERELRQRLTDPALHLSAWDVDEVGSAPQPNYVLTVYGQDRPGIVHGIASALAGLEVGICDMSCRYQGELYLLTMELQAPPGIAAAALEAEVARAAGELGLEHSLHLLDSSDSL